MEQREIMAAASLGEDPEKIAKRQDREQSKRIAKGEDSEKRR